MPLGYSATGVRAPHRNLASALALALALTAATTVTAQADPAVIDATSPSGTLSTTTSTLTVPFTITRTDATPVRLFHVTFQLAGGLTLTGGTAGITEGSFLTSAGGTTTFQVIDNGGGSYTADCSVLGLPCNVTGLSGNLFNIAVSSSSPGGTGTVTITEEELRDCDNNTIASTIGSTASVAIDNEAPSVTVTSPNGGETWIAGSTHAITWTATDNVAVTAVDIAYSTDGGASYPNTIATGLANSGSFSWTVPATLTANARVRVTAHDAGGNTAADASDTDFTIAQWIITASAGAHGAIAPSGAVGVNEGGSQGFTITPDTGYHVLDVLVDGSSVGQPTSYNFSNVTANHTIAVSFAIDTYTITASAGANGSIAPPGVTNVDFGGSQLYTFTPDAGYHVLDVLVDGSSVGAGTTYTFTNVTASHTISVTFSIDTYTITASAGANGSIAPSGVTTVNSGGSQAYTITPNPTYHVFDVLVDGSSVGAVTSFNFTNVLANHTIAASFDVNPPVTPITALTASQVTVGNDTDGTTQISITWPTLPAGETVQVYRAPFGNYPEYDNAPNPGSVPLLPSYPPGAPWTLTSVTTSGGTDEPATRDFWYYVAFVTDVYGTVSPVSNLTTGTLDYDLGDVTNGTTPGQGDNHVDISDITALGAHYGLTGAAVLPFDYLDVGPTTNHSVNARPTTDQRLDFEDLVMFAINFGVVSAPQDPNRHTVAAATDAIALEVPDAASDGLITTHLKLSGTGLVQGASIRLSWNPAVVTPVSYAQGDLLDQLGGVALSSAPGVIDVVRLGVRTEGLVGEGTLAAVSFRRLGAGDPALAIATVDARDTRNQTIPVATSVVRLPTIPTVTSFDRVSPNPFRADAELTFSLSRRGVVELALYSVDGRRVRTLASGMQDPGVYSLRWDGRDDDGRPTGAGIYYARLVTGQGRFTRSLVYLR